MRKLVGLLLLGTLGCPSSRDTCVDSTTCYGGRVCRYDPEIDGRSCVSDMAGAGGGSGVGGGAGSSTGGGQGATLELCTNSPLQRDSRTELLRNANGTAVAAFRFVQVEFVSPSPCRGNLETMLTIENTSGAPLSLQYEVAFVNPDTGRAQRVYRNSIFNLGSGASEDVGVVFPDNTKLQFMAIVISAQ